MALCAVSLYYAPTSNFPWSAADELMNPVSDAGFAKCMKCDEGVLLPLSDYGRQGAPIRYKAWVCSNPDCGFNIRIDNGEITFGRSIGQSYK